VTPVPSTLVPLAGLSGQQTVGALIIAGVLLAFAVYAVLTLWRRDPGAPPGAEVELAPNRKPYYDDDVLEGPRLDRALLVCLGMLVIVAVALPVYWLREPGRESHALKGFDLRSVQRGAGLFASTSAPQCSQSATCSGIHFGCADCHGSKGQGGQTTFVVSDPAHPNVPPRQVTWSVPPLNTVLLRFKQDDTVSPPVDEVKQIIVYGRAGTPMPPWGLNGGGPLDDQQINDLLSYLQSIQLTPAQANADWEARAKATAQGLGLTYPNPDPMVNGMILFDTNCARCHTKGYSYGEPEVQGGGGQYAPNITNGSETRQFPAEADQIAFVTVGVDPGKGYGTGGIMTDYGGGMPHFGSYLTKQEIQEIVDYERGL
jgi:mono/diheme cytochrome c family protein/cytochrome c553